MKSFASWNSVGVMLPEESSRKAMSMMLSQASISGRKFHNRMSFVLSCEVYTVRIALELRHIEVKYACICTSQLYQMVCMGPCFSGPCFSVFNGWALILIFGRRDDKTATPM